MLTCDLKPSEFNGSSYGMKMAYISFQVAILRGKFC